MNTNWPDVFVALIFGVTLCGGLTIVAWLAEKGHPWLALLAIFVVGGLRFKTGTQP